ncbi:MAG: flagellar hook-length control protein FliK, partial [Nitrospinota bacterium]
LAGLLGVTYEELSQVEIGFSKSSDASGNGNRFLQALMPNGSKINLSDILGIESQTDANSLVQDTIGETVDAMAKILDLSDSQADELFSALKVSSIELKVSSIELKADSGNALKAKLAGEVGGFSTTAVKDAAKTQNENPESGLNAKYENGRNAATGAANGNESGAKKTGFDNTLNQADDNTANGEQAKSGSNEKANSAVNAKALSQADNSAAAAEQAKFGSNEKTDSAVNAKTLSQVNADAAVKDQGGSAKAAGQVSDESMPERVRPSRVMAQIVEKAAILSLPNRTHARITLSPASLGTVEIKLTLQDAQIRGAIAVESPAAKQIIEQNIHQLKDALNQQGISVEEINISLNHENTHSFDAQWARDEAKNYSNNDPSCNPASFEAEENAAVDVAAIRKAMLNKIVDVKA